MQLTANLGLLGYFKYTYFIVDNIRLIGGGLGENWTLHPGTIILPLGISFYTFLSISYTLDVYRRPFKPVRNFALYLSYVMFWPHMIAGPILRAHELIPQLVRYEAFDINRMAVGVRRILFGLFLKVALADQLAPLVDDAFLANPLSISGLELPTMAIGFWLQIYFDFAGYSMIAIGSALLLGIHFPENFNWPYMARSPREFWKRWHITLSSWIRDYLYLPLSGSRYQDRSEGGLEVTIRGRQHSEADLCAIRHLVSDGTLAWGKLDVRILGPLARNVHLARTIDQPTCERCALASHHARWMGYYTGDFDAGLDSISGAVSSRLLCIYSAACWIGVPTAPCHSGKISTGRCSNLCRDAAMHFASTIPRGYRYEWPRQVAEIGLVAVCGFIAFIFLRPASQFIYFQF